MFQENRQICNLSLFIAQVHHRMAFLSSLLPNSGCSLINAAVWGRVLTTWWTKFGSQNWRYGIASGCTILSQHLSALRSPMMTSIVYFFALFFQKGSCCPTQSNCLQKSCLALTGMNFFIEATHMCINSFLDFYKKHF